MICQHCSHHASVYLMSNSCNDGSFSYTSDSVNVRAIKKRDYRQHYSQLPMTSPYAAVGGGSIIIMTGREHYSIL